MVKVLRLSLICSSLLLLCQLVHASHIRAGEITIQRIDNFTFQFTLKVIRDSGSSVPLGGGFFSFGDGNIMRGPFDVEITPLGDELELNVIVVQHTYNLPHPTFIVSYEEMYRNHDILNMENSDLTAFYVESMMRNDVYFGFNNSLQTTVLPIDKAGECVKFVHNPGAYDLEDDSISFRMTIPKQNKDFDVFGYQALNDVSFYENPDQGDETKQFPATLKLDSILGNLEWDAPGMIGEYNVAFIMDEWRKINGEWVHLGYVTRDMQIIVEETDNDRPTLNVPRDLCVVAGTHIEEVIEGLDPNGDPVMIEGFGEPFEISGNAIIIPNEDIVSVPAFSTFSWQTACEHVKGSPYEVIFKITDFPEFGPKLVEFENWFIEVIGPAPEGLVATNAVGKSNRLQWDPYVCDVADTIEVWRRVGSYDFNVDDCQVGMPAFAGYELIELVPAGDTEYLDNNNGLGLAPGANYCYRLVARFPEPRGGLSYVSAEACVIREAESPILTNVDITETSEENGEIFIRWAYPYDLDVEAVALPLQYELFRIQKEEKIRLTYQRDTTFVDKGLNTTDNVYTYQVYMYDALNNLIDSSARAGSVRLNMDPNVTDINMRWEADVPWTMNSPDFPYHYIYRDHLGADEGQLVLLDSVPTLTSGFSYTDTRDLQEDVDYCYYISTSGTYDNLNIAAPLINESQINCASLRDIIPPCAPVAVSFDPDFDCEQLVYDKPCDFQDFTNHLLWQLSDESFCEEDVVSFNVYFSETGLEEDYTLLASTASTDYFHSVSSFKGCYRVSAVDFSGNESELTTEICNDNCPNYLLPTAFSPNDDGVNDTFTPFYNDQALNIEEFENDQCPRFVKEVQSFRVFDRTGNKVYELMEGQEQNRVLIGWDGRSTNGDKLPAGTYFYIANVKYDVLQESISTEEIKGWIQLVK